MPLLHCLLCHHEFEGPAGRKCDWCGGDSYILKERTELEDMIRKMKDPGTGRLQPERLKKRIFVFGSNLAGVHGAGSARAAYREHGATYGVGSGPTGSAYAIPTKDENIRTLPISKIRPYVLEFIDYAKRHPELEFDVVKIGCGLAGYKDEQIAPLFRGAPANVHLHPDWQKLNTN